MRIGKSVWHAKRIYLPDAEIPEYEKPIEIVTRCNHLTVMPVVSRGLTEIIKSGETMYSTWTVIANARIFDGVFKAGDLMWVDGAEPIEDLESQYGYGATANAIVKNVAYVNHTISITIERNQDQVLQ